MVTHVLGTAGVLPSDGQGRVTVERVGTALADPQLPVALTIAQRVGVHVRGVGGRGHVVRGADAVPADGALEEDLAVVLGGLEVVGARRRVYDGPVGLAVPAAELEVGDQELVVLAFLRG